MTKLDLRGGLKAVLKELDMTIAAFSSQLGIKNDKSLHEQLTRNNVMLESLVRWAAVLDMLPSELLRAMELASVRKQVATAQVAKHNTRTPHNKRD